MNTPVLILAATATLLLTGVARAEDAVVPDEFEQQQSVDACARFGTGFAKMPGTNTCVRASGYLRYEKSITKGGSHGQTVLDFETRSD